MLSKDREKPLFAIPKGRILYEVASLLEDAGIIQQEDLLKTRKLVFELSETNLILLKPKDILQLIASGQIDIGIVGRDLIKEYGLPVQELIDLGIGKCSIYLCGKSDLDFYKVKSVCSSYPNIARKYIRKKGYRADVVELNGSVEVAPLIGYADCIIEIVDTGQTLSENGLYPYEEILKVSSRLVTFRGGNIESRGIRRIISKLEQVILQDR